MRREKWLAKTEKKLLSEKSAARRAAETKGKIEWERAGKMAAWTKKNGKDDIANPYSKENYYRENAQTPQRS